MLSIALSKVSWKWAARLLKSFKPSINFYVFSGVPAPIVSPKETS